MASKSEIDRLRQDLHEMRIAIDDMQARQLAVLVVLKLALKHHPNASDLNNELPQTQELFERTLLYSPLSERMREVAHETLALLAPTD
jgi:hypothetical protein